MLNSLTIFLAFVGFLIFGYASLVRILYKQEFGAPWSTLLQALVGAQGLQHIGSSAFFISLPATSLLLFWGWAPALLWLVIFHLLADSLLNLQVTAVEHNSALSEYLVGNSGSRSAAIMGLLLQVYIIVLLSLALTLLAQLLDKQSGLLFALLGLIPAHRLLCNANPSIPKLVKQVGAFALLLTGFTFANELGFALYGDWAPFNTLFGEGALDWFRFNNTTILAAVLLTGGVSLANNERFSNDVSVLAGVIVIITIIILMIKLVWLQPILDAPLNRNQLSGTDADLMQPPVFVGVSMFLFAGLTTLFFRVFNSTAPSEEEIAPAADFGRIQTESLIQLFLALLLVLCLASAMGIGAWKTHYLDWQSQNDFVSHFNLAVTSLLKLIHSGATAGNFMHTAIMAGLSIAGLSFLRVCIKALTLSQDSEYDENSRAGKLFYVLETSKLAQILAAFALSSYLIVNGISVQFWILLGILSWLVVMQLIVAMTYGMTKPTFARLVYGGQCLILVALGVVQSLYLSFSWLRSGETAFAVAGLFLVVTGILLWWQAIREIIRRFGKSDESKLF